MITCYFKESTRILKLFRLFHFLLLVYFRRILSISSDPCHSIKNITRETQYEVDARADRSLVLYVTRMLNYLKTNSVNLQVNCGL